MCDFGVGFMLSRSYPLCLLMKCSKYYTSYNLVVILQKIVR